MNATKTELSQLQEQIAAGNAPKLPDGKADEFYWHPTIPGFGLRLYANGSGTWLLQYRNKRGVQRRHKIGSASVLNLTFATNTAKQLVGDISRGQDPQGNREAARAETRFTFGALAKRFLDERQPGKPQGLGRHTHYMYEGVLKNHTGQLARMQHDEIEPKHITDKVIEIAGPGKSPHMARWLRTFMRGVYTWGRSRGLITCPNPVHDTWVPPVPRSKARTWLSRPEAARRFAVDELALLLGPELCRFLGHHLGRMPDRAQLVETQGSHCWSVQPCDVPETGQAGA
jgi:hypothetical protein